MLDNLQTLPDKGLMQVFNYVYNSQADFRRMMLCYGIMDTSTYIERENMSNKTLSDIQSEIQRRSRLVLR